MNKRPPAPKTNLKHARIWLPLLSTRVFLIVFILSPFDRLVAEAFSYMKVLKDVILGPLKCVAILEDLVVYHLNKIFKVLLSLTEVKALHCICFWDVTDFLNSRLKSAFQFSEKSRFRIDFIIALKSVGDFFEKLIVGHETLQNICEILYRDLIAKNVDTCVTLVLHIHHTLFLIITVD